LLATLIPGMLALGCVLTCVGVLTREWRKKAVTQLLAGDKPLGVVLAGRLLFWVGLYSVYAVGYVAWFAGWEGWSPQGSLLYWCIGAVLLMSAMGACAFLFSSLAPSWIIALSAAICYIAPTFPFTGFSYPIDSMDVYAQALCQIFPLTWFLRLQSSQWVLASDFAHTAYLLSIMTLFTLVPAVVGSLFIRSNFARKAAKESQTAVSPEPAVPQGFFALAFHIIKRGITNHDTFIIFVGATAFYLMFYAWPYANQQITGIPTAVVDLDRSSASREVLHRIESLSMLKVSQVTTDAALAHDLYKNETVAAVITIPEGFESHLLSGKQTAVRLTANGAFPVKSRAAMASLMTVVNELGQEATALNLVRAGAGTDQIKTLLNRPVALTDQSLYNTLAGYAAYIVPLVMPIILQAVILMCLAMTLGGWLAKEKTPAILQTVLGSAKGLGAFVVGFWMFGLAWMLYAMGPDFALFNYTSLANPLGTVIIAALLIGAVVFFGLAVTLILNSNAYAAQCLVLISAPAVFLTGAVFAPFDFLLPAKIVADLLPTTPGCIAMVSAAQNGASTLSLMPYIVHLVLLNIGYGVLSIWLARKRAHERGIVLR
ncbi:MAG: ABC transporter permease, partial [Sutterellaceae bacterium]|nr:ABC transporter permease [Sutterellaceae bacterium]